MGIDYLFVQQPIPTFHYDNDLRVVRVPQDAVPATTGAGYQLFAQLLSENQLDVKHRLFLQNFSISANQNIDAVHYSPPFSRAIG